MRPVNNPERLAVDGVNDKTTLRINPGPGTYKFNDKLNGPGKYYTTKYRSSGSKAWNPPSSQRFYKSSNIKDNSGTGVPGANNYQLVNDMSDSGKYVLSVNKGHGCRKFDREFRANFVNEPAKITKST